MHNFYDIFFEDLLTQHWDTHKDSAHDLGHVKRVVANAVTIAKAEGGNLDVILPAAWLHDIVNLPKDHPDRARASVYAADKARDVLTEAGYHPHLMDAIHHAIAAHSFSANIPCNTLDAKIMQDADRLDALGAIGMARCFAVSGALGRALFDDADPLAAHRTPDDKLYAVDHFQVKLYRVADSLHTPTAKAIAAERVAFMKAFETQLAHETTGHETGHKTQQND